MGKRNGSAEGEHEAKRARILSSPFRRVAAAVGKPEQQQVADSSSSREAAPDGLSLANATAIMSGYIGSLRNNLTLHNAVYEVVELPPPDKGFACTVKLPDNSPVRQASSTGFCISKQAAKASAAYHAICALYAAGEITSSLQLTPKNPTKTNRGGSGGAGGATASKSAVAGSNTYSYIASPKFWDESPRLHKHAYGSVVSLSLPEHPDTERQCRQLLMVTAVPLPFGSPAVTDIGQNGVNAAMTISPSNPIKLSKSQQHLRKGFEYTLALFRAAHSRQFGAKLEDARYLILPLRRSFRGSEATVKSVDWDEVEAAAEPAWVIPEGMSSEKLEKKLVNTVACDDTQTKLRFYIGRLRRDLDPSSPHPEVPETTIRKAFANEERAPVSSDPNSAVFEAERYVGPRLSGVVGSLTTSYQGILKARGSDKLYILPGGVRIHPISASTFRTASVLAEGLSGLDAQLLAIELSKKLFNGHLDPTLARQAITSPSARPTAGTDNYERLELLGDTLLKFVVGVDCYMRNRASEGDMSDMRHDVVSNAALRKSVIEAGVPPYIRVRYRAPKDFVPPGWWIEKRQIEQPTDQVLGDKVLADVCEALIAAAYLTAGRKVQGALDAMHALHVSIQLTDWSALRRTTLSTAAGANGDMSKPLTILGYKFKDPRKGRIALSMSHQPARRAEFERYEFLGDALLDYLTVEALWDEYPTSGPGPLTHMKHSRVGNAAFSAYLVVSGLIDQLIDVGDSVAPRLKRFSEDIYSAKARADGLIASGDPEYEFWASVPEHKSLGDAFEAAFGAIYDDSGFDLPTMRALYAESLLPFVRKYAVPPHGHSLHPRSALLELIAKRGCRQFKLVNSVLGDPQQPKFTTTAMLHGSGVGTATAASQALAARNACAEALRYIRKKGGIEQLCDCKK